MYECVHLCAYIGVYVHVCAHMWCVYRHRYVVWVCSYDCVVICGYVCAGVVGKSVCVSPHVYMWVLGISNLAEEGLLSFPRRVGSLVGAA